MVTPAPAKHAYIFVTGYIIMNITEDISEAGKAPHNNIHDDNTQLTGGPIGPNLKSTPGALAYVCTQTVKKTVARR